MSDQNSQGGENDFRRSPTGPPVVAPRIPFHQPPAAGGQAPRRSHIWSLAIFVLLVSGVVIRAYQDLSQPDAWDYWKDQYISPSMTFSVIANADLDGAGRAAVPSSSAGRSGPPRRTRFATGSTRPSLPPAT